MERALEPLGLVVKAGVWYVVARSGKRVTGYRVSRFDHVEAIDRHFTRPKRFDLAAWWRDGSFDGYLSINVSPWQLARPDFVGRLLETIRDARIDPHLLMLEITESAVLYDGTRVLGQVTVDRTVSVPALA